MSNKGSSWKNLSLWPNQNEALGTCERYLRRKPLGDALVHMPTGMGKTGVIAVLSSNASKYGAVLVLSLSSALADQLRVDIKEGFWNALKLLPRESAIWAPERVEELLPSRSALLEKLLDAKDGTWAVFVGTLQALQQIQREKIALYERLKVESSLLIVDEGHREPAPEWAESVRELDRPSILFTATPYRNDLKLFEIADDEYIYYLSFNSAVEDKLINKLQAILFFIPRGITSSVGFEGWFVLAAIFSV